MFHLKSKKHEKHYDEEIAATDKYRNFNSVKPTYEEAYMKISDLLTKNYKFYVE